MSILFSGDFHANAVNELSSITKDALLKKYGQEKYNCIKYHIILGDGGFMWQGNRKADLFNYKVLAYRPFPVLCVIGNHEPILGMDDVPETDIGIGETVYQINDKPFVAYLKRGKVYTIDGIKFLVLGGALSVDKIDRTPNKSWWEKEYWTEQEERDVFKLLETDNNFDCVISHTGPHHINMRLFESIAFSKEKFYDEVAFLNDEICSKIEFREWWCGHWHQNKYYFDAETKHGYHYLYKATKILEKTDYGLTVHNDKVFEDGRG
jgi:3-oxoacid CoA-transferase subunit A